MDATLQLTHERVDDVPLLLGFLMKLRLPEIIDRHLPPHPLHQGLSNGWLITVWIAYILSQADQRKSHVQEWVEGLQYTIETLIGQPIRPVEFSDDRLTLVLKRLSDLAVWQGLESSLWRAQCEVYALPPVKRIRLDATTTYGYHTVEDDGLMQLGHSKDHRPDLPQIKLMAAAASPAGCSWRATFIPAMRPTTRSTFPCIGGFANCWARLGCSTLATARWQLWRREPRSQRTGTST